MVWARRPRLEEKLSILKKKCLIIVPKLHNWMKIYSIMKWWTSKLIITLFVDLSLWRSFSKLSGLDRVHHGSERTQKVIKNLAWSQTEFIQYSFCWKGIFLKPLLTLSLSSQSQQRLHTSHFLQILKWMKLVWCLGIL